ncbi:protocadherin-19-like isoform X2 [Octopus sinensis]|uniref:Protocadherin-19-like isoform X2 n=1 Tax=Octopus sinensis TaxID=2607531 RepID=A0A7E6FCV4_9MOLL|nr:protocadherin-19-like isoform X2 [Octopus sinensis]
MFVEYLSVLLLQFCLCMDITYHVNEEDSPHTYIGDIAADSNLSNSLTHQQHTLITFTQLQRTVESGSHLFNVTNSGKLYTTQTLDAESLCTYNKECSRIVKVAVRKGKTFMKILKVKVTIEDINDNQPTFPTKEISLEFDEGDGKGMKKSIPNAIDKDVGFHNHMIKYFLANSENEPFSLIVTRRADGISMLEIVLEERLDREMKDIYNINVVAKDEGSPTKQSVLKVRVIIKDENDNRPVFSRNIYNVSIKNTHNKNIPILTLSSTDSDTGENKKVSYYFSPMTSDTVKRQFQVDHSTGKIFSTESSSLDTKLTYQLYIEARDGGSPPLSSIATVLVNVINQHNNPPSIDIDYVSAISDNTATISEDTKVGSFIAYVMVTDNDVGYNGQVSCSLHHDILQLVSMGSKEFKIVMKSSVDRETQDYYNVLITCQDEGFPSLKTEQMFSLQVTDANDVQPQFNKDMFKFLTYENEKPHFPIGFINATDPDLGLAGKLTYSLLHKKRHPIPFQISNYGFISTNQSLDREHRDFYEFEVFVKDNGSPSLNNTVNVEVEVLDRNDNAPYFTFPSVDPFTLDVHYHPQSKNDITVLRASDRDNGNNAFLKYEIVSGNERQLFKLDLFTGVLSYSRTVYQNDAGSYELEFVVKDSGTPVLSATTSVSLTLTVSNKTSPMFTAVHLQSGNNLNLTWVIIIVVAAVIISVAIVVSVTLCFIRGTNTRNNSARVRENSQYHSRAEMKQLIYQTNNPIVVTKNPEEMLSNNSPSIISSNQFYPEENSSKDWKTATLVRTLPKSITKYSQPIVVTSSDDPVMIPNYLSDSLATLRDSCLTLDEQYNGLYEEIPAMSGFVIFQESTISTQVCPQIL